MSRPIEAICFENILFYSSRTFYNDLMYIVFISSFSAAIPNKLINTTYSQHWKPWTKNFSVPTLAFHAIYANHEPERCSSSMTYTQFLITTLITLSLRNLSSDIRVNLPKDPWIYEVGYSDVQKSQSQMSSMKSTKKIIFMLNKNHKSNRKDSKIVYSIPITEYVRILHAAHAVMNLCWGIKVFLVFHRTILCN